MTGQQLKNSILQLAIQGKLVPQDPNDEPASKLLARIRKEKEQLVKDGKLKKKDLVTTPITDEEKPFDIPECWEWCRLNDIYNFVDYRGKTPTKVNEGVILITATNIKQGYLDFTSQSYISEEEFETRQSRGITRKGDILFTTEAPMGHIAINTLEKCSCGQRIITFQSFVVHLCNELFCYFMQSSEFQTQIADNASGMTATGIKGERAKNLLIPLPPPSEQHRIVEKIEELMPLVEQYGKSQEKLEALNKSLPEALKKSILQEAIMGRLVPQDPTEEPASALLARIRKEKEQLVKEGKLKKKDLVTTPITDEEKPFGIPESWEWCRLGEICSFLSRGRSPKYSDVPNQYPVFAQKCNLKEGGISLEQARFLDPNTIDKWQEIYKLKTGDILVNSTGTGTVCRTRLFHEDYLGNYPYTVPDSHVSVVRTFNEISSSLYYYLFNSKHIQDYWEERLAGSTNQKELYIGTLQDTLIPLPPLPEQHRIVKKIEELFDVLK